MSADRTTREDLEQALAIAAHNVHVTEQACRERRAELHEATAEEHLAKARAIRADAADDEAIRANRLACDEANRIKARLDALPAPSGASPKPN